MSDDLLLKVRAAIGSDRVTTAEAARRLEDTFKYSCPDDLAKTLNRYRVEGKIKGEVSFENGGWIWWTDDTCLSDKGGGIDG